MTQLFARLVAVLQRFVRSLSKDHRAAVKGVGWTTLGQIINLVIKIFSVRLVARQLTPEAYGVYGPAMDLLVMAAFLTDLGIHYALIRHPDGMTPRYLSTGWLMLLAQNTAILILLNVAAGGMAAADQPQLAAVLPVISLGAFLYAAQSPCLPALHRELNYWAQFVIDMSQSVVGTGTTLILAYQLHNVWAIVYGTLAGEAARVVFSYLMCPPAPWPQWDWKAFHDLWGLGWQVLLNTLTTALWQRTDKLIALFIGITLADLGLFAMAAGWSMLIESLIFKCCDVYFSLLARQPDREGQDRLHQVLCAKAGLYGMGLMLVGMLLAPVAISLYFGDDKRYLGSGVILAVLIGQQMMRTLAQMQFQYLFIRNQVWVGTVAYLAATVTQLLLIVPLTKTYGNIGMALCFLGSTTALALTQTALLARERRSNWAPFVLTLAWMCVGLALVWGMYGDHMGPEVTPTEPRAEIPAS